MGTFHQLTYHAVFATKHRRRWLVDVARPRLYDYIGGLVRSFGGSILEVGGTEDHVHMLLSIPPAISVSEALRTVKANSSRWSRQERLLSSDFSWQKGYGIFTVSYSQRNLVAEYIRNQPEHHRCKTFAEEYMSILKKHGLSFDPAHLFEQEHYG